MIDKYINMEIPKINNNKLYTIPILCFSFNFIKYPYCFFLYSHKTGIIPLVFWNKWFIHWSFEINDLSIGLLICSIRNIFINIACFEHKCIFWKFKKFFYLGKMHFYNEKFKRNIRRSFNKNVFIEWFLDISYTFLGS